MRIFTIIVGILLILTGIYCFINMKAAFVSLALILGIVMMAYGISQIIAWFTGRKDGNISGWVLGEGVLTTLIGALVVFYPFQTNLVLAIWFAAWLIVSGVMRVIGAVQTKRHFPGSPWGFMMLMGVVTVIVGIYGLIHPMVAGMAIAMLLGIFFILQGVNSLVFGVSLPGMKNDKNNKK